MQCDHCWSSSICCEAFLFYVGYVLFWVFLPMRQEAELKIVRNHYFIHSKYPYLNMQLVTALFEAWVTK